MNSPDLRSRFNWMVAFLALVGGAVALLLAMPLEGLNVSPVVIALQTESKLTAVKLLPYLFVGALGAVVGLAELSSTFSDYPLEAIATRWGQYLVWLNIIAAVGAFFIAKIYAPPDTNPILLTLGVGVGFPALIRTKFTLAKQFGGGEDKGDLSINLGWLYDQFQYLCKKQIDLELMTFRRRQVDRLLQSYGTVPELYNAALYVLKARATLTPEEETAKREELQKIIDPTVPAELARLNLGLLILELGGVAYVNQIAQFRATAPPAAAGGAEISTDAVVKQLSELTLADLEQRAGAALASPADQERLRQLMEPVPGLPEPTQKASIAHYLVDRIGAEQAQKLAE